MSEKQIFKVVLEQHEGMDATGITIPFDVEKVFGAKRVPVKVSVNGVEYRSTIMRMRGKFMMAVPKVFRAAASIKAGEMIEVTMEKDSEKRTVEVPEDFAEALRKADLTDVFAKMSFTHQKEYVNSINDAKKEETRLRRIEKNLQMLREKKK
ncbi:MAG TPA: YdeI/OmpD-associated family protein [Pyrinomonadaceae bacterium]|nr:YdeI/OmpD-associated family protein [Pyrinomonadaceae bacterium]